MQDSSGPDQSQSPPPSEPPSESPPSSPAPAQSDNRTLWVVLSYLGIFALIPLLAEKDDSEVQWHAKHGLVLLGTWIVLYFVLMILSFGLIGCVLAPLASLAILVIHVICIAKGIKGERFRLPLISDLADKWQ